MDNKSMLANRSWAGLTAPALEPRLGVVPAVAPFDAPNRRSSGRCHNLYFPTIHSWALRLKMADGPCCQNHDDHNYQSQNFLCHCVSPSWLKSDAMIVSFLADAQMDNYATLKHLVV